MERRTYTAESLSRALGEFEEAYGMTSDEFYAKHESGEDLLVPRFERHVWASFVEDVRRLEGDDDLIGRVSRSFAAA